MSEGKRQSSGMMGVAVQFHFIASTGRTATTFLARAMDQIDGVVACHEGYKAADKDSDPVLPLINLENRRAFDSLDNARDIVAQKRDRAAIEAALAAGGGSSLVDVAYYNPTIAVALLETHPDTRMVGIIRELEPFVRSSTATQGEDLLPVGWPDPEKPLTPREKFIALGRIRPAKGTPDGEAWADWSAIMRNIWLWRETNKLLIAAKKKFPDRVLLMKFEELGVNQNQFLSRIAAHFGLDSTGFDNALDAASGHKNQKPGGYQICPLSEWSDRERAFAEAAEAELGATEWLR